METQELGCLAQADLVSQIALESLNVWIIRFRRSLRLLDGALRERPEEPVIQRIQDNSLFFARAPDDYHFTVP